MSDIKPCEDLADTHDGHEEFPLPVRTEKQQNALESFKAWLERVPPGHEMATAFRTVLEMAENAIDLPPNHLLLRAEVVSEHESPDWESCLPGYDYSTVGNFQIVADTLGEKTAAELVFEVEGGDAVPDGIRSLTAQIARRFAKQQQAFIERITQEKERGMPLIFPDPVKPES